MIVKPSYTNGSLVQRAGYYAIAKTDGTGWNYYKMTVVTNPVNAKLLMIIGYTGPKDDGVYMQKAGECYLVSRSNIIRGVLPIVSLRVLSELQAQYNVGRTNFSEQVVPSLTSIPLGSTKAENFALDAALEGLVRKYPELNP